VVTSLAVAIAKPAESRRLRKRHASALVVAAALAAGGWLLFGAGSEAPTPKPASALLAGGITVSPLPGAREASPETEISFLGATAAQLGRVSAVGSSSGQHAGRLVPYASERGTSFVPTTRFTPGEHVTVTAAAAHLRFSFAVSRPAPLTGTELPIPARKPTNADALAFASAPALHPPRVTVTRAQAGAAAGFVFLAPIGLNGAAAHGQVGPLIVDGSGNPVWARSLPPGDVAMNFHPQTYRGKTVLTWWQGRVSPLGYGIGQHVILDSTYRTVATIQGGNGYSADLHDLQLTVRGSAFITAYRPVHADLRRYGGARNGELLSSVVQEVDLATGRVMFEWDPLDHVSLKDSYTTPSPGAPWDAFHVNAVDLGHPGELLVTARNTWAAYDVDARSGQVSWRLGGKHSTFHLGRDERFAWQHDARFLPGGRVSLFDDEAAPKAGTQSRVLVFRLDTADRTAKLVTTSDHSPAVLASSQGNAQTLPNGNMFVGWGAEPYYSEFTSDGRLVYDARLPGPDESYRAFRATWTGRPTSRPSVAVRPGANRATTVHASWNGATEVSSWRVLAGSTSTALSPVTPTTPRTGFETTISTKSPGQYFAVQALDASGRVIATSRAVRR
jgi:hypothetical protein